MSEQSMIERVARAIATAGGSEFDKLPTTHGPGFGMRRVYENMARAAIEAMREPTQAIIDAPDVNSIITEAAVLECWDSMIAAALEGK